MSIIDTQDYWSQFSDRLLPLGIEPELEPVNIDALHVYWGGERSLRPAAVLVGLVPRPDGMNLLLTRRHDGLSRHAGQISFPGGRVDADDSDAVQAAMRETFEEVGVAADRIHLLGRLEPLATVSEYLVQPIVARLDPGYELRLQTDEVSEAFELPLARAACAGHWQPYTVERPGLNIELKALEFQGHTIWGATAMIIERLVARLQGLSI